MEINISDLTSHINGRPGDHMHAEIQQLGEEKSRDDTTDIIVDCSEDQRDIRIVDGDNIIKIQLDPDYTIQSILKNDVYID